MEQININPNILAQMLAYQATLLPHYIRQGSLPEFPVSDLVSKSNQKLLKGFVDCFVEELSEAYNEQELMLQAISNNNPTEAKKCLAAYNEEVADAWHFLLEFLVYANYEEDKLESMVLAYCRDNNILNLYVEDRPFRTMLNIGNLINYQAGKRSIMNGTPFRVIDEVTAAEEYLLRGGRRISDDLLISHRELLWSVTHTFQQLKNTLKNRAWTETERGVNMQLFEEKLLMGMLHFATYLDFANFTESSIARSYIRKNTINRERQKNGY